MIPDCERRLAIAWDELSKLVVCLISVVCITVINFRYFIQDHACL